MSAAKLIAPRLHFVELRPKWMDLRLDMEDKSFDFSIAAVFSEPLRDLCDAFIDANEYVEQGGDGPWHFEFEWLGEGWMYNWKLKPEGEIVHVNASFAGSRVVGDTPSVVWDFQASFELRDMSEAVWNLAGQVLNAHGLVGYRALWGREFPLAQLLELRAALDGNVISSWQEERAILASLG